MKNKGLWILLGIMLLAGCVTTETAPEGAKTLWVGEMTGMGEGEMKLNSWEVTGEGDVQEVNSQVLVKITSTAGGYGGGTLTGRLTGRIKDGLLEATFVGFARVSDGNASVHGRFIGTVSETQGFGTWDMTASGEGGRFTGEWSVQRQ